MTTPTMNEIVLRRILDNVHELKAKGVLDKYRKGKVRSKKDKEAA